MRREVEITELSPGGDGVAICTLGDERRAVFVPGVARGERVRVDIDPRTRPARGTLVAILAPSAERVAPACAHVERCGGCDWMHLAPAEQTREHARIVSQLLGIPVTTTPAPHALRYRTRARVHVHAAKGDVVVGMFARGSHAPAVVDTCVVLDPVLDRARGELAGWLEGAKGRGEASLSLGAPRPERQAVLDLRWNDRGELPASVFARLEKAVASGQLAGARVFTGDVRVPATIGDPTPWIEGADGLPLRLAPGGFSQATEAGNLLLARRVAELAATLPAGAAVELYAGAGNLTVLLARGRDVVAVEHDRDACAAARENLRARGGLGSWKVVEADASAFTIPKGTKLVVLDPPREGARAVARALAERGGQKPAVLYIACDPPTLARDVRTLAEAGYTPRSAETFELFPQTSHVETVVVLT